MYDKGRLNRAEEKPNTNDDQPGIEQCNYSSDEDKQIWINFTMQIKTRVF